MIELGLAQFSIYRIYFSSVMKAEWAYIHSIPFQEPGSTEQSV